MIKREELSDPRSCMNRAADTEMTFVLLGRDKAAPVAIEAWIAERIRLGKNSDDDPQIVEARQCLEAMRGMSSGRGRWHTEVTAPTGSGHNAAALGDESVSRGA